MSYISYKVNKDGLFSEGFIALGKDTVDYLENIQEHVYSGWKSRHDEDYFDTSLAMTYNYIIHPALKKTNPNIDGVNCDIRYFSGNINTIDEKIFKIIFDYQKTENKFIVLTMTSNHKDFYNYDGTQMTISTIKERFMKIFPLIKLEFIPDVYVLCINNFKDLIHQVKYQNKNNRPYIYLSK